MKPMFQLGHLRRLREALVAALWVVFLLTLPFESSPLLPDIIGGRAVVRPLAVLPMMALFFLEALPRVWKRPWPRAFLALLAFWLVALVASGWGLALAPDPEQGFSPFTRVLRGLMTLSVGSGFYLVTWLHLAEEPSRGRTSLRWLYAALVLSLLWGSLQVMYIWRKDVALWETLNHWHRTWVGTRPLQYRRVVGVTYEPSWFAVQSLILFFPWLLGSVLTGVSAFPWRKGFLQVETGLLVWLVAVLLFTFSRVGLAVLFLLMGLALMVRLWAWGKGPWRRRLVWVLAAAGGMAALAGVAFWGLLTGSDYVAEHFTKLWERMQRRADEVSPTFVLRMMAGSRWGEWQYGYRVYSEHPVLGVGLGLLPFYLDETVPAGELSYWFYESVMPGGSGEPMMHTRHLYLRLLAETGWVGTALFLAFQLGVVGMALALTRHPDPELRAWGWCGLLAMAAVFLLSIAFDSFSLPHHWVVYGWVSGLYMAAKRSGHSAFT